MSMAQIQIIGHLGRDPEMSYSNDGVPITKFSIAVSTKRKGEETTNWFNCTAFRGPAETINMHCHKGDQLFVQGPLDLRHYTTRDGKPGVSLDVVVDKFTFIGGKRNGGGSGSPSFQEDVEALPGDADVPF